MDHDKKSMLHTDDRTEEIFSEPQNLEQILSHPANYSNVLNWEQVLELQALQYPNTEPLMRNLLLIPFHPHNNVQKHQHTYFEMIYVISGSCAHHVENNYSILNEGDFCILPPGISHYIIHGENARLMLIMIRANTLKALFPALSTGQDLLSSFLHDAICKENLNYYLLFHTEKKALFYDALYDMQEEMYRSDEYSDRIALTKLTTFLLTVARDCKNAEISSGESITNLDQQILAMIYEQYSTITLSQLAEMLHYSVPYCSKYLKKNMGCTFSELIQKVRFQQARNLLLNSNLPVNQIGKNIGYETPENFFRAFKKVYHMTPSQYRRSGGLRSEAQGADVEDTADTQE